ncbi:MAG: hypothetical protein HY826_12915 [Actinobacteria bacterium]|nr:hypothetical protein [Actinomycetota bacterium]
MNTRATTESIKTLTEPVGHLGGHWMLHPEVMEPCRAAGYPNGYVYYGAGRGGVLGDVDADVIAAAFGFFEPSLVRRMWEAGTAVEGAAAAAARYGAACVEFGRSRLQGFAEAERVAELAERVALGADATGLPLFAGWRRQPLPDDLPGRAYFLMHLLRELRGGAHVVAVVASGLAPRDAVLASGGADMAKLFGWPEPYGDPAGIDKQPAEQLTDAIVGRLYDDVLNNEEVKELAELVISMRAHFDGA